MAVGGVSRVVLPLAPRVGDRIIDEVLAALDAQTVSIGGTADSGRVLAGVTRALAATLTERRTLAAEGESRLDANPLAGVATSMPGVGVPTAVTLLTIIGDGSAFPTAAHLAAYAGLAPVTRRSGNPIRGPATPPRRRPPRDAPKPTCYLSPKPAAA